MQKLQIKITIIFLLVATAIMVPHTPTSANSNEIAVVKVNILNVRQGPGLSYPIKTRIMKNKAYPILERKSNWIKIELSKGSIGWVAGWLVTVKTDSSQQQTVTQPTTQQEHASSKVDALRVRTGPGTSFQIIGHIYPSQSFPVLQKQGQWTKIQYKNAPAWVATSYLSFIAPQANKPVENSNDQLSSVIITASSLNVRKGPGTSYQVVGSLKKGQTAAIRDVQNGWYQISSGKLTGWIAGNYAKKVEKPGTDTNPAPPESSNPIQGEYTAIVNATVLNVRSGASTQNTIIDQLKNGEKVNVIETKNDWNHITYHGGNKGWVAGWYLQQQENQQDDTNSSIVTNAPAVSILYDGTNIRKGPTTNTNVVTIVNQGDQFPILDKEGDWYQILLPDGVKAYVAGWIVATTGELPQVEREGIAQYIKGKTIVIDPGHGGRDSGAVGVRGSLEKNLTLRTARLLADKLEAAGAKVILTRTSDYYLSLSSRVSVSHYHHADAFLSVHYNSSTFSSVAGISTFYYTKQKDYTLSEQIQSELVKKTGLKDRKVQYGNFQVLRTNKQPASLLELGFLSNPGEEYTIQTESFQEQAVNGVLYGLARYFHS